MMVTRRICGCNAQAQSTDVTVDKKDGDVVPIWN